MKALNEVFNGTMKKSLETMCQQYDCTKNDLEDPTTGGRKAISEDFQRISFAAEMLKNKDYGVQAFRSFWTGKNATSPLTCDDSLIHDYLDLKYKNKFRGYQGKNLTTVTQVEHPKFPRRTITKRKREEVNSSQGNPKKRSKKNGRILQNFKSGDHVDILSYLNDKKVGTGVIATHTTFHNTEKEDEEEIINKSSSQSLSYLPNNSFKILKTT